MFREEKFNLAFKYYRHLVTSGKSRRTSLEKMRENRWSKVIKDDWMS